MRASGEPGDPPCVLGSPLTGRRNRQAVLVDAAIDSYVDWREESAEVRQAYRRWSDASRQDRRVAFAAYAAALDREALASDLYAAVIERVRRSAGRP